MKDNLFPYIARLYDNRGKIIGSGFLTSPKRLLTASHVILGSLDALEQLEENRLLVMFDLPLIAPGEKYPAKMILPSKDVENRVRVEQSDFLDDFVVLETNGIDFETNHKFAFQPATSLTGNRFWTFGFLDNYSDGMAVTGEILGPGLPGILQLQGDNPVNYFVQRGFSGSPVWDVELGAVVAMIVAAEEGERHFAVAITLDTILKTNPILAMDALTSMRLTYKKNLCQVISPPEFEVASPLDEVWDKFNSFLPWHEQIAEPLKRIRHSAASFRDLDFLESQINNLRLDAPYEILQTDVRRMLEQAYERNVFRIISAHKKRLEQATGLKAPQIRKLTRRLDTDENTLLQIDAIHKNLFDLKKLIGSANFQRCFCITGGLGAGKTHFLNRVQSWVKNDITEENEQFILLLELPDDRLDFNQLLLNSLSRYFEMTFSSPETMHQHFLRLNEALQSLSEQTAIVQELRTERPGDIFDDERFGYHDSDEYDEGTSFVDEQMEQDSQISTLGSMPPPAHVQLILAIDDISRWSLRHRQLIPDWIKTFKEWTGFQEIFWIGTMPLNFYPNLMVYSGIHRDVWQHYGIPKDFKVPNIGGWIALDNLNIQEETGILLIQESNTNASSNIQVNWLMKEVESRDHLKRILSNPFNAWAFIETLPSMQVHSVINLSFIDFIHKFRDRQYSTILSYDANLLCEEPVKEIHLHQFVDLIAGYLSQHSSEQALQKGLLIMDVVRKAEDAGYDFSDKKRAEFVLFLLSMSSLLNLRQTANMHSVPVEVVEILFETFWHYILACRLLNEYPKAPESSWVLEVRLSRFRKDQLSEILEFYLLLVSQQDISVDTKLMIFEQVLKSRILPKSAVWYAGAKSSPALQPALIPILEQAVYQTAHQEGLYANPEQGIQQTPNQESLYALMYFIGELSYNQINFPKFVSLLQVLCPRIKGAGLEQFYVFLVGQALEAVKDPNDIIAAMPYFTGCEVLDIEEAPQSDMLKDEEWSGYSENSVTAETSSLTIYRLQELVLQKHQRTYLNDECYREIITMLLEYLNKIRNEFTQKSSLPQKEKRWKRQLFREWALYHFLGDFVDELETDAYAMLFEQQWYEHPALRANKLLTLQMEQEANIALGRLMWTGRRYSLIDLVSTLSASNNQIDHRNAFHIIRHTVPTSGGSLRGNIDKELHPILRDLYLDRALDDIVNISIFEDVFRQLEDFDQLSKTRAVRTPKTDHMNQKQSRKHWDQKKNKHHKRK
jgi:hypothetical protein